MIPEDLLNTNHNRTDEERQNITAPPEDTYAEIRSTEGTMKELELKKTSLLETSVECQQVPAPIQRLPREMIEEIFKACVADVKWPSLDHYSAPILLTRISSDLRHIALTCPPLWSRIVVHLDRIPASRFKSKGKRTKAINAQVGVLEEWIRLSGSEPLTLDATFNSVRPRHLSEILGKCSFRWNDVSLTFDYDFFAEIFSMPADNFPLLSRLNIECNSDSHRISSSGMLSAPNLRKLGIYGVINPLECDVDWSRLTHLSIDLISTLHEDIAIILRQATSLVDLALKTMFVNDVEIDEVLLPNLNVLSVTEFEDLGRLDKSSIAPFIRAPLLESLYTDSTFTEIEGLLEQCPHLRTLVVDCIPEEIKRISTWLQHLPLLEVLHITAVENETGPTSTSGLLEALLDEQNGALLCPHLHELFCHQVIELSIQTLTQFLRSAQIGTSPRKYRDIRMKIKLTDWNVEIKRLLDELIQEQANCGVSVRLHITNMPAIL